MAIVWKEKKTAEELHKSSNITVSGKLYTFLNRVQLEYIHLIARKYPNFTVIFTTNILCNTYNHLLRLVAPEIQRASSNH